MYSPMVENLVARVSKSEIAMESLLIGLLKLTSQTAHQLSNFHRLNVAT